MEKINSQEIVIEACKLDAIRQFDNALQEAGGAGYESFKHVTVEKFMEVVSQNGIRVCFSREWHMNRLNPSIDLFTEAVNSIIKKR